MLVSGTFNKLLYIVLLFVKVFSLEVVPIEKNIILITEYIIRNITNDIFLNLSLKGVKNNTKLQQNNLIHNFFTKIGVADQHTLTAINTVSRFDKTNINNKTQSFMVILNELLDEDAINDDDNVLISNINVLKFIEKYLSQGTDKNVEKLKHLDFNDLLEMLQSDMEEDNSIESSVDNDTFEDNRTDMFWEPIRGGRRIYQGIRTKVKHYPFMASIQIFRSFQCGGSIIKTDLIITAASCLQLAYNNRFFRENPAFLSVRVGSDFYQGGGDNIEALEVYFAPGYDPKTLRNNLAIIRLQRHINFRKRKRVKRIDIDRKDHQLPYNAGRVTIVGWGARTTSNILDNPWSNRLSYADLGLYYFRDCVDVYSKEFVTKTNFCAGSVSKGSGACNKDAGDPGVINGILVGVASFGSPMCGTPDAPTVFTKVGFYSDWIEDIMEQHVPSRNKHTTTRRPLPPRTPDLKAEYHRLTTFSVTPVVGTESPMPIQEIDQPIQPISMLRHKKKGEDEEIEEMLYGMLGDKSDPKKMRQKIKNMIPKLKKFATSPEPMSTEEFMTTDVLHQKHTVIDKVMNEDVDVNIAKIIDKLDEKTLRHEQPQQLLFEGPIKGKSVGKNKNTKKIQPLIDIEDLGEEYSIDGLGDLHTKGPDDGANYEQGGIGTVGLGMFDSQPIIGDDDPIRSVGEENVIEPKKIKKERSSEVTKEKESSKKVITEHKKQDHKKERSPMKKPEDKMEKLREDKPNIKKQKTRNNKPDVKPIDRKDSLEIKTLIERQLKQRENIHKEKQEPTKPTKTKDLKDQLKDEELALRDILDGVLGDGLGGDLTGLYDGPDGDKLHGELDGGLGTLISKGQQKLYEKDKRQQVKLNQGQFEIVNEGPMYEQEFESDTLNTKGASSKNIGREYTKLNNKNVDDPVLTLLYLSSEEKNRDNKHFTNEEKIIEKNAGPAFNNLLDLDNIHDGLDVEDDFRGLKDNDNQTFYDYLPKEKLYDLLSDAIEEMTSKH